MNLYDYINSNMPTYLDLLKNMVEINSYTSNPDGVNRLGNLTAEAFSELGFQPQFIQSVNPNFGKHLFMKRSSSEKISVAMVSHLDTVFSPAEEEQNNFSWRIEGEKAYGPGTVDIKGGTVMIYIVMQAMKAFAPHLFDAVDWYIAIDASEEALSEDFGQHCLKLFPSNTLACLVFEGGTVNRKAFPLVVARKGRAAFQISVEGRSAHAGNNHALGANAILQIAHTIQQIEALTDYKKKITYNVGIVRGGSVVNRVPHFAQANVEMRAFSPDIFSEGLQKIAKLQELSHVSSQDGFSCRVKIEKTSETPPWPRNPETDHLFNLWKDAAQQLGLQVTTEERGGLSDGNLIYQRIPTLDGLGPTGDNAHCSERSADGSKNQEYVITNSFPPKALLNLTALITLIEEAIQ
jgi:glutamate carboxypeptidase